MFSLIMPQEPVSFLLFYYRFHIIFLDTSLSFCLHSAYIQNEKPLFTGLPAIFFLFKLAKFGLILVVSIWLSILFCIDISHLFHTLFFVSHIFSTNPVPLHFFIIVCSSSGLQVGWTIQRIIVRWFASSPMGIII